MTRDESIPRTTMRLDHFAPMGRSALLSVLIFVLWPTAVVIGEDLPDAEEVAKRVRSRLDGQRFTATVQLEIRRSEFRETRKVSVWRDDENGRRERLMASFESPPSMRGMGLLYLENLEKPNDYFIYQPELRRVRRIPETLAREDVYGVDLEYLGFGVAQLEPARLESIEAATLHGKPVYRLTERATRTDARFDRRLIWIDPGTYLPMRTEHRNDGEVTMIAETQRVEIIDGNATPVLTSFERPRDGEQVSMTLLRIEYGAVIPEAFFSTLQLVKSR